jgi:hypothetical protein
MTITFPSMFMVVSNGFEGWIGVGGDLDNQLYKTLPARHWRANASP